MTSTCFSAEDIEKMETQRRAALLNSLSGFKSASLIGTVDLHGNTNLAIFSSVVHLGSNPPLMAFVNRPDSVSRHTLENILETRCFTINHIHSGIFTQAHQTAARYPKLVSEFEAVGLTPEFRERLAAPFVAECKIKYGLIFAEKHELKINGTILMIGQVVEIIVPEDCLQTDGALDLEKAETVAISGLDSYHGTSRLARLSYAKPDKNPEHLPEQP